MRFDIYMLNFVVYVYGLIILSVTEPNISKSLSSVMFFRKGSSVLISGFDSSLSRVTIEMRRINSFTHEGLWVVTHTAKSNS